MENNNSNGWVIAFLVGLLIWTFFFRDDKYEGRTAEEWFNQYDYWNEKYTSFRNCVEDYDNFDIKTKLDYGGVFYYCE